VLGQPTILIYVHDLTVATPTDNTGQQSNSAWRRASRRATTEFQGFGDGCNSALVVWRRKPRAEIDGIAPTSTLALCEATERRAIAPVYTDRSARANITPRSTQFRVRRLDRMHASWRNRQRLSAVFADINDSVYWRWRNYSRLFWHTTNNYL